MLRPLSISSDYEKSTEKTEEEEGEENQMVEKRMIIWEF
jgi:hypothetical protein